MSVSPIAPVSPTAPSSPAATPLVLLVDDEPGVLDSLSVLVRGRLRYRVRTAGGIADALEALERERPDVVVTDIAMDGREAGVDLLRRVAERWPGVPVILMSAVASREAAIHAVNAHAFAFLEKPFANDLFERRLREALETGRVRSAARAVAAARQATGSRRHNQSGDMARRTTAAPAAAPAAPTGSPRLVGESPAFLETLALVEQVAPTTATVLFEGESGVGKGALASHLHACSPRAARPLIAVNCGAIPETLIESQFFGHVKGAFTGADQEQPGFLRAAEGGTLFLDEVTELSPAMQVKLLRVLQEREAIPVGGTAAYRIDVRFVAATNRDLRREVNAGRFREDLFWRLNVMAIEVPPLRRRVEDVPLLATHALTRLVTRDASLRAREVAPDAMALLTGYPWPGNVRELENALERAAIVADEMITIADLPPEVRNQTPSTVATGAGPGLAALANALPALAVIERAYVAWVVAHTAGDVEQAAAVLGIPVGAVRALLAPT